jgi:hypothetical protein
MKPFTIFSLSALLLFALLTSCNPTRTIIADDLYYQRPTDLAIGEDPNDPTSYSAFKTRQLENKQSQLIENNRGTSTRSFYRNNTFFNNNFQNRGMWGNQFNNPNFYPYYHSSILLLSSPLFYTNGYSFFNNYGYNHYGYNQWGQYIGYGYGNNYYGNSGYWNGYSGYGYANNLGYSNVGKPSKYTTISGPRGGYNTLTGNRDTGGGAKYRSMSTSTSNNNASSAVRVAPTSVKISRDNLVVKSNDRGTSSTTIKTENRPMGNDGRAVQTKTYESRPIESNTSRPVDSNRPSVPQISRPRETGSGSERPQPSTPSRSTPSKSSGSSRSGGRG